MCVGGVLGAVGGCWGGGKDSARVGGELRQDRRGGGRAGGGDLALPITEKDKGKPDI